MSLVYFREGNPVFHRTEDCVQLNKRPARGSPHMIQQIDLQDMIRMRPCHTCYPDAPRVKFARRHCSICNKKRLAACPHNGGVKIIVSFATKNSGDGEVEKPFYVWPDQLYRFATGSHSH